MPRSLLAEHRAPAREALFRPVLLAVVVFRYGRRTGGSTTQGCLDDVKMWMSGGKRSGSSSVPTRTKRTASPAPA